MILKGGRAILIRASHPLHEGFSLQNGGTETTAYIILYNVGSGKTYWAGFYL